MGAGRGRRGRTETDSKHKLTVSPTEMEDRNNNTQLCHRSQGLISYRYYRCPGHSVYLEFVKEFRCVNGNSQTNNKNKLFFHMKTCTFRKHEIGSNKMNL